MSRNLALFDLDHTLLPLDSDQAWAHFIAKLGVEDAERLPEELLLWRFDQRRAAAGARHAPGRDQSGRPAACDRA